MSEKRFPHDLSGKLFDTICKRHDLSSDTELSALTAIHYTKISKVRNGHERISDSDSMKILRNTNITFKELESLQKVR